MPNRIWCGWSRSRIFNAETDPVLFEDSCGAQGSPRRLRPEWEPSRGGEDHCVFKVWSYPWASAIRYIFHFSLLPQKKAVGQSSPSLPYLPTNIVIVSFKFLNCSSKAKPKKPAYLLRGLCPHYSWIVLVEGAEEDELSKQFSALSQYTIKPLEFTPLPAHTPPLPCAQLVLVWSLDKGRWRR